MSKFYYKTHNLEFDISEFIEHTEECPICKCSDRTVTTRLSSTPFAYYHCNNCSGVSASHYLTEAASKRLFESYYLKHKLHRESQGVTHHNVALLAAHISSYLSFGKSHIYILDFGGGSGLISYEIALILLKKGMAQKVDIHIVDINDEQVVACDNDNITINKYAALGDILQLREHGKYDLVIASAVLEHVYFAHDLIAELFRSICINGYIYIRTPYLIPLYKFLKRFGVEIDLQFPDHVHDFSKAFFEKLPGTMKCESLEIIASRPSLFENSFRKHFMNALISRIIRFPYHFNHRYPFVGSWEVVYKNTGSA
ncbi:MAG: class I SAM-dependent methyltransferase [Oscillospiraceae bacterium]|nr:class I SAM-dependent methyltransferase [Oscillospiraceae bacterium]MCL2279461.1 class I SAM-dependent methyltransferase [Oscillospiraceae bacterium]